jgi:hypothetical protein
VFRNAFEYKMSPARTLTSHRCRNSALGNNNRSTVTVVDETSSLNDPILIVFSGDHPCDAVVAMYELTNLLRPKRF